MLAGYLFIIPTLIPFLIFRIYPAIHSIGLSFFKYELFSIHKPYIGLENYLTLLANPLFWRSFKITMYFVVAGVVAETILALALALLFNSAKFKLKNLFKAIYFLPVVTTMVAVAIVWEWLYQPQFGLLNYILSLLGLPKQGWLLSQKTALLSVIIMSVWKNVGYSMIIFLAGLQIIPQMYYEAAVIDGASRFDCFRFITLPLLMPITLVVVVMSTIRYLQAFDQAYVMTSGGPMNSTLVLLLYIYRTAFEFFKFGYASAMAMMLFIIILVISLVELRIFRSKAMY